jgi:YD repeat-containing protein
VKVSIRSSVLPRRSFWSIRLEPTLCGAALVFCVAAGLHAQTLVPSSERYDSRGRLLHRVTTNADGSTHQIANHYAGSHLVVIHEEDRDASGRLTRSSTKRLGPAERPLRQRDIAYGRDGSVTGTTTSYTYDPSGHVQETTKPIVWPTTPDPRVIILERP